MIQIVVRQSTWGVLKDFIWWYFVIKCNEFHPSLEFNLERAMKSIDHRGRECMRVADARYRAHRLDNLYTNVRRGE